MALASKVPCKLLIIGGGLTGALTAHLVNREEKNVEIHIWEANEDAGGRMSTAVNPSSETSTADLGAQFYEELLEANILKSLKGTIEGLNKPMNRALNFVAPSGTSSIVKHFLNSKSDSIPYHLSYKYHCVLSCNEKVLRIGKDGGETNKWTVSSASGKTDTFDAVVLTPPIPEILQIQGLADSLSSLCDDGILGIHYSSRFALALFYDPAAQEYFDKLSWIAKYFSDDEVIRFISIDHKKRGRLTDLPAVIVHSTVEFGARYLNDDIKNVQNLLFSGLQNLLPEIPLPSYMKCHVWKYSQVTKPCAERCGCTVIAENPLLILGGDAFTESNFDGCIDSAVKIVEEMLKRLC